MSLNLVKPTETILKKQSIAKTISKVINEIVKFDGYSNYRNDIAFLKHIINLVHNSISKKYGFTDQEIQDTIVNVLQKIFNYNPEELVIVKNNVKSLVEVSKVKKISILRRTSSVMYNYLKKTMNIKS
jgi:hypothetical protein